MFKRLLIYAIIVGVFGYLTQFIIEKGSHLQVRGNIASLLPAANSVTGSMWSRWVLQLQHPLSLLLLQIVIIVLAARFFGRLVQLIGQPSVVGEIIAGICLGPSLLGLVWPGGIQLLFPADSLKTLQFLSQIGLVFFMFVVGMELDHGKIKHRAKDAIMISHASIVIPFFLGVWLAYYIYPLFGPKGISFLPFSLFIGIAMSITAFPVLARIVQERGLTGTPLGSLAITCAAADDITAWCILAAVVAIAKAESVSAAFITLGLAVGFIGFMLYVVKQLVARKIQQYAAANKHKSMVVLVFILLLASAWITEIIGIHALFGAFLAGVIMPPEVSVKKLLTDKIEDVSMLLLLPIFFAYTGLRTQIGLIGEQNLWLVFGLIMAVAVGGKFGGSAFTARLMGQSWTDSLSIGALMNTRGLMELIVLNIGYDLGILSPEIFALLVLMALLTTFMTGPLLTMFAHPSLKRKTKEVLRAEVVCSENS
jgi:Kef-type K+ transport system membrane component KefB